MQKKRIDAVYKEKESKLNSERKAVMKTCDSFEKEKISMIKKLNVKLVIDNKKRDAKLM